MKKDNKGFSLVELIVVVAIMAVLMVVISPALLKNVEKTRLQRDNSAISEIANAAKIACADEDINKTVSTTGPITITLDLTAAGSNDLQKEVFATVGEVKLQSNTYTGTGATKPSIVVEVDTDTMAATVKGIGVITKVKGTASTATDPIIY